MFLEDNLPLTSIIQVLGETKLQALLCQVSLCLSTFHLSVYLFVVVVVVFFFYRTLFKLARSNANPVVQESNINKFINVA